MPHALPFTRRRLLALATAAAVPRAASADEREEVLDQTLRPWSGESPAGIDRSTLTGKFMCGYQGWFNAEGDGAKRGWVHWTKRHGRPGPENIKVDLWPDMTEYGADERFATDLKHKDGRTAEVFSSFRGATVLRHFRWMREYGIDGAFVQRFAATLRDPRSLFHNNTVLAHCRRGANENGRAYAVMYDLSGMGASRMEEVKADWRALRTRMKIGQDPAALQHRGKPLVAVWGIGFSDDRRYTLAECADLVRFLKDDPEAGGCSVMVGVPYHWRTGTADAIADPALRDLIQSADIVSPWTVGRYGVPADVPRHARTVWAPDLAWCQDHGIGWLPVVFPGFSWYNMYGRQWNSIPRAKGEFYWTQIQQALQTGATMLYGAMFDEVDEGTALFKCTNDPPAGEPARFLTLEDLPPDAYLRLTGTAARMLRRELPADTPLPSF